MNAKTRNSSSALALSLLVSTAFALESDHTVELGLSAVAFHSAEVTGLPASLQSPEYQVDGQVDLFWNLTTYLTDSTDFNLRYGISARTTLDDQGSEPVSQPSYRAQDLPAQLDVSYYQSLDVFNLTTYCWCGTYSLGRQAISFGQAKFFSPIDVIQPAQLFASDRSYRPGVDAIRGTWALGAVSELDAGYVFGGDTVAFARLKGYFLSADWEMVGLNINDDNWIVSLGTNGGIGALGLWQETAWLNDGRSDAYRVTLGVDTTLFDDVYVMNEVHYNGVGEQSDYLLNGTKTFYQLGAVVPQAQWYNSTQFSYPINILVNLNVGATINLNDASTLFNTALSYNASDNMSVSASAILPVSAERSTEYEYGMYPASVVVEADWVF